MRYLAARTLFAVVVIMLLGLLTLYAITDRDADFLKKQIFLKQLNWALAGIAAMVIFSNIHYIRLWDFSYPLFGVSVFLLVLVLFRGDARMGAQRWFSFGEISFQPSEFTKIAVILFLSRYFGSKASFDTHAKRQNLFNSFILPFSAICVPIALIFIQPDLGTAIVYFVIVIVMMFITGVKLRYLAMFTGALLLSLPLGWHLLKDYQKDRLLVFINPNIDPLGAGYTIIQSKIAIGSGVLFGKGLLGSTQSQLKFLPESHTDFIFASFAEQWGFLGSAALILLYFLIIRFGLQVAEKNSDPFGKFLAYGITSLWALHVAVNIAMTAGFAPVVGITLPLMSYGGSSLLVNCISLGILFNISKNRAVF
ncbi:MAG: rod shape-determining protein RodA [Candidatus Omnitrophica bacterium]|nr:rod shape-determining protein RodA [Candidatus Omnitrophota bacterium]